MTKQEFIDRIYHIALATFDVQQAEQQYGKLYDEITGSPTPPEPVATVRPATPATRPRNTLDGM